MLFDVSTVKFVCGSIPCCTKELRTARNFVSQAIPFFSVHHGKTESGLGTRLANAYNNVCLELMTPTSRSSAKWFTAYRKFFCLHLVIILGSEVRMVGHSGYDLVYLCTKDN